MAAVKGTIKLLMSGGADNVNVLLSLGGVVSATPVGARLFSNSRWMDSLSGFVDHVCFYLFNTNTNELDVAADTWLFISQQLDGDDSFTLAYDPAGVGDGVATGVATTIPNARTAPSGVVFPESPPLGEFLHLPEVTLPASQGIAVWGQRTVPMNSQGKVVDAGRIKWIWGV